MAIAAVAGAEDVKIDSETFGGLEARCIGPAAMGGRVAALDAITIDGRLTVYVGSAGGGVWKSTDGGTTFKSVFDKYAQSIGAIAIDRRHPKTVWVGAGESWVRNSVSVGDGLYKTTDGGDT
ncbi:MAG: glycosyl hydrolase, partial [Candidatus Eisenbacteria bacterium]